MSRRSGDLVTATSDSVRLVVVSDTHCFHEQLTLPEGDVLIHAGDFCSGGSEKQARAFAEYYEALPHRHKVVIAGNHDRCLEEDPGLAARIFARSIYLFESEATVEGLRLWGAPWQPWFLDWAFNLPRGEPLRRKWQLIPRGIDVLITHGPPLHILDRTFGGDHAGCEELRAAVERIAPRVHLFGHIHEGYGWERHGRTLFANASICTLAYDPVQAPLVIDVPRDPAAPASVVEPVDCS